MESEEYWSWVSIALYLLIPLDLLTTIYAAKLYGIIHESNIIMRFLLDKNPIFLTTIHILLLIMVAFFFYFIELLYEKTNGKEELFFEKIIEVYLGLLIAFGLFIFSNNLTIIILGRDLITVLL